MNFVFNLEKLNQKIVTFPNDAERKRFKKFYRKRAYMDIQKSNFCLMTTNKAKVKTYLNVVMRKTVDRGWGGPGGLGGCQGRFRGSVFAGEAGVRAFQGEMPVTA